MPSFASSIVESIKSTVQRLADRVVYVRELPEPVEIKSSESQDALDKMNDLANEQLTKDYNALQSGKIDADGFYEAATKTLRRLFLSSAAIGAGGLGNVTQGVLSSVESFASGIFEYLNVFVSELENKTAGPEDLGRLLSYTENNYAVAESARRLALGEEFGDDIYERRRTTPGEVCEDCEAEEAKGWVPMGTLKPIGESRCGRRCRCVFEYAKKSEIETDDFRGRPETTDN